MEQKKLRWMRLDNAAKIYPAARRRNWNNMFRVSATLSRPVDPAVLQTALEATIGRFPSIAVRLRKGVFWYYLEEIPSPPRVRQDSACPLAHIRFSEIRRCAFRVLYYENRIAVEIYHALTDGNGGLVFLKTLLAEYLEQKEGILIPPGQGVLDRKAPPREEELEDSFLKYSGAVGASRAEESAYHIEGTKETDGYLNQTTGILDAEAALSLARSYGATLTEFLTAVMILSILKIQQRERPRAHRRRAIKILVPVNLRRLFPSDTMRNFALFATPGIDPKLGKYTLPEVVRMVHYQMGAEINPKKMSARIATNVHTEQVMLLKLMPLFIKNAAMKLVYNMVGESKACLSLSNLGQVQIPAEMQPYVTRFDFVLGAQAQQHNNCGVLSYAGKLYINLTRNIREPKLERAFFTDLRGLGLHVKVESNQRD